MKKPVVIVSMVTSLLMPAATLASGQLPPMPLPEQQFDNFKTCVAHLEAKVAEDRKQADPDPVMQTDGSNRQTLVYSDGVKREGRNKASYAVEVGYQVRVPVPEDKVIRTSYSYERTSLRCKGRVLTGEQVNGYALEGYAPLEEPPSPK